MTPGDHWPVNAMFGFLLVASLPLFWEDEGVRAIELAVRHDRDAIQAEQRLSAADRVLIASRRAGLVALLPVTNVDAG